MTDRTWIVYEQLVARLEAENRHLRETLATLTPDPSGQADPVDFGAPLGPVESSLNP